MITERTLRNWRANAFQVKEYMYSGIVKDEDRSLRNDLIGMCDRVIRLTMELMDIQLMEKIRSKK